MSKRAIFLGTGRALLEGNPRLTRGLRLARPALRAIPMLRDAGFQLVAVAYEPGVALGLVSEEEVERKRQSLEEALAALDAKLGAFYCCPHHPLGKVPAYSIDCLCRRPQPGLITRAAYELDIDLPASWIIGEVLDDVEAGRRAGCRAMLVDMGVETEWRISRLRVPHYLTGDLAKAARVIIATEKKQSWDRNIGRAS